jgi:hypothetical protein
MIVILTLIKVLFIHCVTAFFISVWPPAFVIENAIKFTLGYLLHSCEHCVAVNLSVEELDF